MYKTTVDIYKDLCEMSETAYRDFQAKLMPTVNKDNIIGVRIPLLRKYAKTILKDKSTLDGFLADLPHKSYEENTLHAILLQGMRDIDECLEDTERLLPYIDNWSTCDTLAPACFKKDPEKVLARCREWIRSSHTYTVRFAIVTLMKFFLDENFTPSILEYVADVQSEEYYILMAQAWFFSFALIKRYDAAIPYLTEEKLSLWVHNKSIQKSVESFRISKETKEYLCTLRR